MDNEFYFVTFEDSDGLINSVCIHITNGETVFQYILRVYSVEEEGIHCIYKRVYAK